MKIIHVNPGLISIPPNGWGAIEKIIWESHLNMLKLGYDSEILYLNEIHPADDQVVHMYMGNLAIEAKKRNIKYFFTMNDHHTYLYGKDSVVYQKNLEAMYGSVKSFVSAKYLIEYFNHIPSYMPLGVNTDFFSCNRPVAVSEHKLLCLANNGFIHDKSEDRKGFGTAIEMARRLNLPITIAGPSNNKHFLEKYNSDYEKLSVVFDLNEEQLREIYSKHTIFIHMSTLEAGHPNMTLLEAMSSGLPVVGTLEKNNHLPGMVVVDKSVELGVNGIKEVISNYSRYKQLAVDTAKSLNWESQVKKMLSEYERFSTFSKKLVSNYEDAPLLRLPKLKTSNKIKITFNNGPKVEVIGHIKKDYKVLFIDNDNGKLIYSTTISNGCWCASTIKYFINWRIEVYCENELLVTDRLSLDGKVVKITLDTSSLGDVIAWFPYVEKFCEKHRCKVLCYVNLPDILNYSDSIKVLNIGDKSHTEQFYAEYSVGLYCSDGWNCLTPVKSNQLSLQEVCSKILGSESVEIKPKIKSNNSHRTIKNKYVCIATQSTAQCKYWNSKGGWNGVVKYLKSVGYDVVCIDKHQSFGVEGNFNHMPSGVINKTGDFPLSDRINDLIHCEFFIGLSSGLSWLAWALNKPVILISGFTSPKNEFFTPYRVHNTSVCNSCWNDSNVKFDAGDWKWCPRKKDFECSKEITVEMVKEKIDMIIDV